jgi:hypothetical protein
MEQNAGFQQTLGHGATHSTQTNETRFLWHDLILPDRSP